MRTVIQSTLFSSVVSFSITSATANSILSRVRRFSSSNVNPVVDDSSSESPADSALDGTHDIFVDDFVGKPSTVAVRVQTPEEIEAEAELALRELLDQTQWGTRGSGRQLQYWDLSMSLSMSFSMSFPDDFSLSYDYSHSGMAGGSNGVGGAAKQVLGGGNTGSSNSNTGSNGNASNNSNVGGGTLNNGTTAGNSILSGSTASSVGNSENTNGVSSGAVGSGAGTSSKNGFQNEPGEAAAASVDKDDLNKASKTIAICVLVVAVTMVLGAFVNHELTKRRSRAEQSSNASVWSDSDYSGSASSGSTGPVAV